MTFTYFASILLIVYFVYFLVMIAYDSFVKKTNNTNTGNGKHNIEYQLNTKSTELIEEEIKPKSVNNNYNEVVKAKEIFEHPQNVKVKTGANFLFDLGMETHHDNDGFEVTKETIENLIYN